MNINIKRVLVDIGVSLIPRLRSDLKPYGLEVDWQINSGTVFINVNKNGKKLYKSKTDVKKNAKIALGLLVVVIEILAKEDKNTKKTLDVIIKELTRLKYKRME